MRPDRSRDVSDTWLLLAGVGASLALVAYLAVAFASPQGSIGAEQTNVAREVAPWTPFRANFGAIPLGKGRGFGVRVTPAAGVSTYGAIIQAQPLVTHPLSGRRYTVGLWLKGARPGRIGVELNEFRGKVSRYPLETTVPATARWHHFMFTTRVKGNWEGLAMYVYRTDRHRRTWFAIRDLTASRSSR